jgi:Ni/Co efflux regulator RcnB
MTRTAVAVLIFTLVATPVAAQQSSVAAQPAPDLRQAARTLRFDTAAAPDAARSMTARRAPKMSGAKRGVLTAIAGVGGFFGGAYLGAAIEGDRCNCDDPGLMGALIGMPIGAATAAIVTWIVTGRD